MHFSSEASVDGVREQLFTVGETPCVLWTGEGTSGPRPLILVGHGGGRDKKDPEIVALARRFVLDGGFAVVVPDVPAHGDRPPVPEYDRLAEENQARVAAGEDLAGLIAGFQALVASQTVPEWQGVLDAVQELPQVGAGPVGYWGVSLGCGLGVPFVAAEKRVRAAVLGLGGADRSAPAAGRITVPVLFFVQWDDERVPRDKGFALFDAFGSVDKTLHANPGKHAELPAFETGSAVSFFRRTLTVSS